MSAALTLKPPIRKEGDPLYNIHQFVRLSAAGKDFGTGIFPQPILDGEIGHVTNVYPATQIPGTPTKPHAYQVHFPSGNLRIVEDYIEGEPKKA